MRRRGNTARNKQYRKARGTKNYTRDVDQIVLEDMKEENSEKLLNQPLNEDKPGLGQFYCIHCARYFIAQAALQEHFRSKQHKKRFKNCNVAPYTQNEADAAAGLQH